MHPPFWILIKTLGSELGCTVVSSKDLQINPFFAKCGKDIHNVMRLKKTWVCDDMLT
jgi:hypothetical protein